MSNNPFYATAAEMLTLAEVVAVLDTPSSNRGVGGISVEPSICDYTMSVVGLSVRDLTRRALNSSKRWRNTYR